VEPLVAGWCWGFSFRQNRNAANLSCHSSATAIDLNAPRHPNGKRGTFTKAQVAEIRRILAEVGNVVRWGGDFAGTPDEMHFEIVASPATVGMVAGRLNPKGPAGSPAPASPAPPVQEDDMTPAESATLTFVARLLDPNVPGSLGALVRQSTEILSVPIHSTVPGSTVQLTPRDMLASVDNSTYGTAQQVTALVASLQAISDAVRAGSGGLTEAQAIAAGQAGAKAALADLGRDLAAIGRG
jgi:hypothetical protein